MDDTIKILYFGNTKNTPGQGDYNHGHDLYLPGLTSAYKERSELPFPYYLLDSRFCVQDNLPSNHNEYQLQGRCALHHVGEWSVLAFWDRTGDSRGASNSAFVLRKKGATFYELLDVARREFPTIFERLECAGISLWHCGNAAASSEWQRTRRSKYE